MAKFVEYTPEEVTSFVKDEVPTLSEEVLEVFIAEKIDGEVFLEITDELLRDLAPRLGDRVKLKRAIKAAKSKSLIPSVSY